MKISVKLLWLLGLVVVAGGAGIGLAAMNPPVNPSPCPPMCPEPDQNPNTVVNTCGGACDPSVGVVCGGDLECVSGYCLNDDICETVETVNVCFGACDPAIGVQCGEGMDCVSGYCLGQVCADSMSSCGAACDPAVGYNCGGGLTCVSGHCTDPVICAPITEGMQGPPALMPTATPNQSVMQPPPQMNPVQPPVSGPIVPPVVNPPASCVDDGVCTEAEQGIGSCRDCSANPGDLCGVPCDGTCGGGLACVGGFCWDGAICEPDGGNDNGGHDDKKDDDKPAACSCECTGERDALRCTDTCTGAVCRP